MNKYYKRESCRLCKGKNLDLVIHLSPTPPANAFVSKEEIGNPQDVFPLDVYFCNDCMHLQLLDVVDPEILFSNYVYVSGTSPTFVKHFENYANEIINFIGDASSSLVVEIGSNDGTLLSFFKKKGFTVLGIDPAKDIANNATKAGIETLNDFFSEKLSKSIQKRYGKAKIIAANNVFAHIDDVDNIIAGIKNLLAKDGVFVFEVSYLVDVIENTLFDTIYHEHLDYHTVKPLQTYFSSNGLELIDVRKVNTHGGSLRGIVQIKGGPRKKSHSVTEFIDYERSRGFHAPALFTEFSIRIKEHCKELNKLLGQLKSDGKRIAGFGAPAKVTTLMYQLGIGNEIMDFIVDDSQYKQYLYSPGKHIPVLPASELYEKMPDYAVILAWNFADAIIKNHEQYLTRGGKFIVPLPKIRVYEK